jgi:hypothetical protein
MLKRTCLCLLSFIFLARLWLGWHQLHIRSDRIKDQARLSTGSCYTRFSRFCQLRCSTAGAAFLNAGGGCVEDVQHFVLIECPAYQTFQGQVSMFSECPANS